MGYSYVWEETTGKISVPTQVIEVHPWSGYILTHAHSSGRSQAQLGHLTRMALQSAGDQANLNLV